MRSLSALSGPCDLSGSSTDKNILSRHHVSFAPVKGDYSVGLKQLIAAMLQKEPELRPSADAIYGDMLPPLLRKFSREEDPAIFSDDDQESDNTAPTKTFLYYLDGHSLLLKPVPAPFKVKIDQVAVGFSHVVVVTRDHYVMSWGEGCHGELGHGDQEARSSPTVVEALKGRTVVRAECGGEFSVFISDNGLIMSCGRGDSGAIGHGDYKDALRPKLIEGLLSHDVVVVSCGESHVAVVTSDNCMFAWGAGSHGRLGTGSEGNCCVPTMVTVCSPGSKMAETVTDVRCGMDGTMILTNTGRLFACGNNHENKLGLNQRETFIMQMRRILNKTLLQVPQALVPTPLKDVGKHRVVDMALGPTHSAVLVETGQVYTFGRNSEGQLCAGHCFPRNTPVLVKGLQAKPTMVTCSELSTIVTTEKSQFLIWGSRPIILSPLSKILSQPLEAATQPQPGSPRGAQPHVSARQDATAKDETNFASGEAREQASVSSPITNDLNASDQTISSGHLASCEGTPERQQSSGENINTSPTVRSNEFLHRSHRTVNDSPVVSCNTGLNFGEAPHMMFPCKSSNRYLPKLGELLSDALDNSANRGRVNKQSGSTTSTQLQPSTSRPTLRRGSSRSSCDFGSMEGIILKPTGIDLLGSGAGILSTPSTQGLRSAKLEGVSCFGCNVLMLVEGKEGQVSSSGEAVGREMKPVVRIGKKMVERRRRKPSSPQFFDGGPPRSPVPIVTVEQEVGLEKSREEGRSHRDQRTETMVSEDTQVPTWLKNEYAIAMESTHPSDGPVSPPVEATASKQTVTTRLTGGRLQKQRMTLPGSIETFAQEEGTTDPGTPRDKSVSGGPSRTGEKKNGLTESSSAQEHYSPSVSHSRSTTQRPHLSKATSKSNVILSSEVLNNPIPEHELEGASLSPTKKTEVLENQQTRKRSKSEEKTSSYSQDNVLNVKPAASVSSIAQPPTKQSGRLNVKRAQSSTDITSPTHLKSAYKQQSRGRARVSAPDRPAAVLSRGGGKASSQHQRKASESPSVSSVSSGGSTSRYPAGLGGSRGSDNRRFQGSIAEKGSQPQRAKAQLQGVQSPKAPLSPQNSATSLPSGVEILAGQSETEEEVGEGLTSPESGIEMISAREPLSSSSEGEVFHQSGRTRKISPSKAPVFTGKKMSKTHQTGHAFPVTDISPYAEPLGRITRSQQAKPHSKGRTSVGGRTANSSFTKQDDGKPMDVVTSEAETVKAEQNQAGASQQENEPEEKALEQQRLAEEREKQMEEEIHKLHSELEKQSGQNREMLELMKSLQKQVEDLQQHGEDDPTDASPGGGQRRRLRTPLKLRSVRSQRRDEESGSAKKDTNRTKSSFCAIM